jgi:hypothetical protein
MSYQERLKLYEQISKLRNNRPLIVYVTSCRQNASAQMGDDVLTQFAKVLLRIPHSSNGIDILIVSNGGDPTVPWRIICMLREKYDKIGALLPWAAYSAATLLVLGADEIIMHPFSNLGPVDPQLVTQRKAKDQPSEKNVETVSFGSEDIRYFLDFVKNDVGVSDQAQLQQSFELICKEVGSIPIGVAKRSTQLALSMSEKLLSLHIKDSSRAKTIAEALNKSFYHHGYPVGFQEAKKIGLPVKVAPTGLEEILWAVWQDIEKEMECEKPFNPIELVLSNPKIAELLEPVQQIQMPANLPPQLAQQAYTGILQQIKVVEVPPIDYNIFQATLECCWCKSEYYTKGKINAVRLPNMNWSVNVLPITSKWVFSENSQVPECV